MWVAYYLWRVNYSSHSSLPSAWIESVCFRAEDRSILFVRRGIRSYVLERLKWRHKGAFKVYLYCKSFPAEWGHDVVQMVLESWELQLRSISISFVESIVHTGTCLKCVWWNCLLNWQIQSLQTLMRPSSSNSVNCLLHFWMGQFSSTWLSPWCKLGPKSPYRCFIHARVNLLLALHYDRLWGKIVRKKFPE